MSTFCHGIASCQALDKSGEIVEISGLDITSLPKTGILNYEHKSDVPGQICGKILSAKKIHTAKDCSNEHETYFWNKCKVPFVYITAELLDDYCQSGKDAAGLFRYDHDKKGQNKHAILGFSVEGSEIPNTRRGMVITRSIARKVTLTASPCNSLCTAELLEQKVPSQVKDDFDSIFKSQEEAITLFKSGEGEKIYEQFLAKKELDEPSATPAPTNFKPTYQDKQTKDTQIGKTKSGKTVFSHGPVGAYGFNPQEHKEAAEHHARAVVSASNPKLIDNHVQRMKAHNLAAVSGGSQQNEAARSLNTKDKALQATGKESKAALMGKSEKTCKHKMKKDEFDSQYSQKPPSPPPPPMPPEPKKPNDQTMQTEIISGGMMGKSDDHSMNARLVPKHLKVPESGPGSYGNVRPHLNHQEMKKIGRTIHGIDFHDNQSELHGQHQKTAQSRGDNSLAEKHGKMADMHAHYSMADMNGPNSTAHFSDRREGLKRNTDKAKKLHSELSKEENLAKAEEILNYLCKSENFGWSKGKVDKDSKAVHFEHPTHGTVSVVKQPTGEFHVKHQGAMAGVGGVKGSFPTAGEAGTHAKKYMGAVSQGKIMAPKMHNISSTALMGKSDLKKAITAGSYNAAPSTLTSGAAYQRESMSSKPATTGAEDHKFQGTKKKDWNERSKKDYESWPQKEAFEKFMKARLPHLADGEIRAFGRALALKKSMEFEKSLSELVSLEKSTKKNS